MSKVLSGYFLAFITTMYDGREFSDARAFQTDKDTNEKVRAHAENIFSEDDDELEIEVTQIKEISKEEYEIISKLYSL